MNEYKLRRRTTWLAVGLLLAGCDSSTPVPVPTGAEGVAGPTATSPASSNSAMGGGAAPSDRQAEVDSAAQSASPTAAAGSETTGSDAAGSSAAVGNAASGAGAPTLSGTVDLSQRPFMTLQPVTSTSPETLIAHLRQVDSALQDLVLAGSSNFLDEQAFIQSGLRLGRMKQASGLQLAQSPQSSDAERKSGVLAQLVALSHMSGLGDVPAAQELERFAAELSASADTDLAHQAQVVLIGFELQSLQNGLRTTPEALLSQVDNLFQRPEDRGFPEFMVLQQAQQVLRQMGFAEGAEQVKQTVIEAYRSSRDPQLRGEAWLIETQESQAYQNFLQAFRPLGSPQFDSAAALAALRGLYEQFPSLQTLEQIASTIANIEYSGHIPLSQDVASFARQSLAKYDDQDTLVVQNALAAHAARTALLGQPLNLVGLVGFDGEPLQASKYEGKVVLVDFWASWCIKCMRELPGIRQSYADFAGQGFDVLSVNMDENLASGRNFVQQQNFPWRSFHSADLQTLGFKSPLAQQLGVNAIPFMLLVGRDGRVAELHVRGDQLRPAIAKLLESTPQEDLSP